jgi:hypothetical protein
MTPDAASRVTPARWRSKDGLESDPILAGPVPLPPHPGRGREVLCAWQRASDESELEMEPLGLHVRRRHM